MTELPAYPAHFDFGRLFADIGQVLTRGWLPLAIGVAVLGAAPAAVTSMPWWQGPVAGGPFLRVWVEVTMLKAAINLVSLSAAVTLMACVSLNVLTAATGLEWRALVGGFLTALSLGLLANWATLLAPLSAFHPRIVGLGWMLWLAVLTSQLIVSTGAGIAVSVGVADSVLVGSAMTRSFRLLRGLRWRMAALGFAYLFALALGEYGIAEVLRALGVEAYELGGGRALVNIGLILISMPFQIALVSIFLQARRIAEGPDAREIHNVFA